MVFFIGYAGELSAESVQLCEYTIIMWSSVDGFDVIFRLRVQIQQWDLSQGERDRCQYLRAVEETWR